MNVRYYYAVIDNELYAFEKKRWRADFCKRHNAKPIYAYERHKYAKRSDASGTLRNSARSDETTNIEQRYVKDRIRAFKR